MTKIQFNNRSAHDHGFAIIIPHQRRGIYAHTYTNPADHLSRALYGTFQTAGAMHLGDRSFTALPPAQVVWVSAALLPEVKAWLLANPVREGFMGWRNPPILIAPVSKNRPTDFQDGWATLDIEAGDWIGRKPSAAAPTRQP